MLQDLSERMDLESALKKTSVNDLLPPREDDKVQGEVGKRFVEYLRKQIDERGYEPCPASFVQVPKPGFTSRPAALMTLTDRVVFEAVVELFREKLKKYLLPSEIVFWPREVYCSKRWKEFEKAPLQTTCTHVVHADISGFYESIDHNQLGDDLVKATGERSASKALLSFLFRIMGTRRGLPQGLLPSDTLATTYLQSIDASMLREGFDYWRHGDDMRVAVESISRGREAIALIESELRRKGLLLNAGKVFIQDRNTYEESLRSGEQSIDQIKERVFSENVEKVISDDDELIAAMKNANLDEQWGWDLFYHQNISVVEVIEQIKGHIEPTETVIAEHAFRLAVQRAPGTEDPLPKEVFHYLITRSLVKLAAARSDAALQHAASIMARFPEKTEILCQYLRALVKSNPQDVVRQVENVIGSSLFTTPWQQAWLFRVLGACALHVSPTIIDRLRETALSPASHWLPKVEAMKVLANAERLDRETLITSWKLAPPQYRSDLLEAAANMQKSTEWARKFLISARLEPIEQVIVAHLYEN